MWITNCPINTYIYFKNQQDIIFLIIKIRYSLKNLLSYYCENKNNIKSNLITINKNDLHTEFDKLNQTSYHGMRLLLMGIEATPPLGCFKRQHCPVCSKRRRLWQIKKVVPLFRASLATFQYLNIWSPDTWTSGDVTVPDIKEFDPVPSKLHKVTTVNKSTTVKG